VLELGERLVEVFIALKFQPALIGGLGLFAALFADGAGGRARNSIGASGGSGRLVGGKGSHRQKKYDPDRVSPRHRCDCIRQ
jgi:hypothetical protein